MLGRRSTPRRAIRGGSTRSSPSTSFGSASAAWRRSRQDVIDQAGRFARAVAGVSSAANAEELDPVQISYEQLQAYFSKCNMFYCRSGDGTAAATSALKTIHAGVTTEQVSCTFKQLQAYFLDTFTKDEKRIDRLEPVVSGILKDAASSGSARTSLTYTQPGSRAGSPLSSPSSATELTSSGDSNRNSATATAAAAATAANTTDVLKEESKERELRIRIAVEAADAEQQRRMSIETKRAKDTVAARLDNVTQVIADAEQEQQRRVAEVGKERRGSALGSDILAQLKTSEPLPATPASPVPAPPASSRPAQQPPGFDSAASGSNKKSKKKKKKKKKNLN
jgi:hypothetical protein